MAESIKYCDLNSSKICDDCRECDICDLNSEKFCDSCGMCLNLSDTGYGEIKIDGILDDDSEVEEYILTKEEFNAMHGMDEQLKAERAGDYEFIEDIPELRSRYEKIKDFNESK